MQSEYWVSGTIGFAIDDSPKHASEYAKHGVRVLSPRKSYNTEITDLENVTVYNSFSQLIVK
jgi:hypothetical protein